ncbi:MAG: hypothetical protein HY587_01550 [Candidatus Omnitrophica bacterium]|nr:hypothetical protein [Candidatus Omnitrophota bacterium]
MNKNILGKIATFFDDLKYFLYVNSARSLPAFFVFVGTPARKEETPPIRELSLSEQWFGLKAYTLSSTPFVRLLGWAAVTTLSLAIFLVVCLTVSRLSTLWDLWFEAIRRPDTESAVQRFLRILSFWLIVAGIAAWLLCKIIT